MMKIVREGKKNGSEFLFFLNSKNEPGFWMIGVSKMNVVPHEIAPGPAR